jgi:cation diffusion facilitator family transporter
MVTHQLRGSLAGILGGHLHRWPLSITSESTHAWADGVTDLAIVAGIVFSGAGLERMDPAIGIVVAGLIAWRASRVVRGAADVLTDAAAIDPQEVVRTPRAFPGVRDCHAVRSRGPTEWFHVDLHVLVDPSMPVAEAHEVAVNVQRTVTERIAGVAEVFVHIGAASHEGKPAGSRTDRRA